jgi:hypothetical protein
MAAGDEQDGVGVEFGVAEVVTDVPGIRRSVRRESVPMTAFSSPSSALVRPSTVPRYTAAPISSR